MSRAYRLRVSRTVERVVVTDDEASSDLELLPLLPKERMAALLDAELGRRGFEVDDGVARRDLGEGLGIEIIGGRVTVRMRRETKVKHEVRRRSQLDTEALRQRLLASAQAEAEERTNRDVSRIEREAARVLEQGLRDMQAELDRVVHAVTATALEEKARSLGEITELHADPETGELVIRVKL